ncbi:hypothetical protein GW796_05885 [archaeon]|nr:hypothetical protein [archaeon]NCQ51414.1 hypothetical protein [archaeon]NCT58760.1 hypothetical protein [archaeon]
MVEEPKRKRRRKKGDRDYIDNKRFTKEISEWVLLTKGKKRSEWPDVPEFVTESILLLVSNYAKRYNFRGYTYLDEMKAEATLNCFRYLAKFNPEKSDNAYGYYSKCIENSFRMILKKEKEQAELRNGEVSDVNCDIDYTNIQLWYDDHDPNFIDESVDD